VYFVVRVGHLVFVPFFSLFIFLYNHQTSSTSQRVHHRVLVHYNPPQLIILIITSDSINKLSNYPFPRKTFLVTHKLHLRHGVSPVLFLEQKAHILLLFSDCRHIWSPDHL